IIRPSSLLDSCTIDGKIYFAPVNIHSWQWLWLSNAAFKKAVVEVPKNCDEFVAAAPALEKAGIIPLAVGGHPWQATGAFDVL
ncbi:extracellular solute-binding protein, partial [Rhizobium ruizarguesonis]